MFRIEQMIGYMPYVITKLSVGSAPVQLVPNDPSRAYVAILNQSGSQLFVGFDGTITGTSGPITINNLTIFEYWWERHGVLCTLPLFGAISAAPNTVYVIQIPWRPTV